MGAGETTANASAQYDLRRRDQGAGWRGAAPSGDMNDGAECEGAQQEGCGKFQPPRDERADEGAPGQRHPFPQGQIEAGATRQQAGGGFITTEDSKHDRDGHHHQQDPRGMGQGDHSVIASHVPANKRHVIQTARRRREISGNRVVASNHLQVVQHQSYRQRAVNQQAADRHDPLPNPIDEVGRELTAEHDADEDNHALPEHVG